MTIDREPPRQGFPKDAEGEFDIPATDLSYDNSINPQLVDPLTGTPATSVQDALDALKVGATNVAYYVDLTGSDSNPGTVVAPFLTFFKAWDTLNSAPRTGRGEIRFLSPGTYDGTAPGGAYVNSSQAMKGDATPPAIIGLFTNEVGTVTETVGDPGGQVITDGALALLVDAYKQLWVVCTSSATPGMVGQRIMIRGNTPTTVTLQAPFADTTPSPFPLPPLPISIGDTFEIQQPSVVIDGSPNGSTIFGFGNEYVLMQGIRWNIGGGAFIVVDGTRLSPDGVIFDMGFGFVVVRRASIYINSGPWERGDGLNPISNPGTTGGALFQGPGLLVYAEEAIISGFHGFAFLPCFNIAPGGLLDLQNPIGILAGFQTQLGGQIRATATAFSLPGTLDGPDAFGFSPAGIDIHDDGGGDLDAVEMINQTGPAILVENRSRCAVRSISGSAGNLDVGISVQGMSQVSVLGASVTGANGDVRVGALPVSPYGALPVGDANLNRAE